LPVGEAAVLVEYGQDVSPLIQASVSALEQALLREMHPAITEWIPTYRSLLVHYDPLQVGYQEMADWLSARSNQTGDAGAVPRRRVTLPVLYGGEMGPDLPFVAQHSQLPEQEVVRLHQQPDYLVYMLGFMPGFPYLGGLDPRIVTPRLTTPRTSVPAGSVGIADRQTGVYPLNSPGGWQLIGRTPVRLYAPERSEPIMLRPGDLLKFRAVTADEYREVAQQVAEGGYQPLVEEGVYYEQS
jgi:KipI family sensor histidine kinase inhibitor